MGKGILFFDTETTGVDKEDKLIEAAYIYVNNSEEEYRNSKNLDISFEEGLYKADLPIKPAASMMHGYSNKDVVNKSAFKDSKQYQFLKEHAKNTYLVAHNAQFDIDMLKKEGIEWDENLIIDTLNVAKHILSNDEGIEMFKLQYLRYYFNFDEMPEYEEKMKLLKIDEVRPHTALSDIFILWFLFDYLLSKGKLTFKDMVRLSQTPIAEPKIRFGGVFEKDSLTYDEVVVATYEQYGKIKKGYDYLMWADENMSFPLSRSFAVKSALAKGVLEKKIPQNNKTIGYLYWGALFSFSKNQREQALKILGTSISKIEEAYLRKISSLKKEIEEASEETEEFKKKTQQVSDMEYLYRYYKNWR